ncbi:hypothetical protein D3C85_448570 [compost metagenome]
MSKEESTPYSFKGDNAKLVDSIKSLLALDSKGALVPNGIGGRARQLQESAVERLAVETQPAAWMYKENVWATGLGAYVWREKIELDAPSAGSEIKDLSPLFTRSDAGEIDRLNTVIEQQENVIASLRAELTESYSIDEGDHDGRQLEWERAENKRLREALSAARNDLLAVSHLAPGDYIQKSVASAEAAITLNKPEESKS